MFGCYRKDEVSNPEFYLTAAVGVLTRYSEQTILKITDPVRGLPATSKFLPSIAEIKTACEIEQTHFEATAASDKRRAEQLKATQEDDGLRRERATRPTYDELKEKYGDDEGGWGFGSKSISEAQAAQMEATRALYERAARVAFERECAANGLNPAHGVSPSLLKLLGRV